MNYLGGLIKQAIYLLGLMDPRGTRAATPPSVTPPTEPQVDDPPAAPTGLVVTGFGESTVTLNWDDNSESDLDSYRVYLSTNGVTFSRVATTAISSYQVTGLISRQLYYFKVSAVDDASQEGALSSAVSQTTTDTSVTVPTGLIVTAFDAVSITLDWDDSPDSDLSLYRVYISTDGVAYSLLASPVVSTYQAAGLSLATYYFKVSAVDTTGNESATSNVVSQTTIDSTPPEAPQNLRIVGETESTIALAWELNDTLDGVSYYRVYISQNGVSFSSVGTSPDAAHVEGGLTPGTTYYFKVSAVDEAGNEGDFSDIVSGATLPTDVAPSAPTGMLCTMLTSTSLRLNWNRNPELDLLRYKVYRSTDGANFTHIATPSISHSLTQTGLAVDTRFYYYVTAVDNALNESGPSAIVSGLTSQYTFYDASYRAGEGVVDPNPSLLPAHLDPLEGGDLYRLNGTVTPVGAATVVHSDGGFVTTTFLPQSTPATYTGVLVGVAVSATGIGTVMSVNAPAGVTGDGTWKIVLVASSFGNNDAVSLEPSGYTALADSTLPSLRTWERIATGSDSTTLAYGGASAKVAYTFAVQCPGGWPTAALGATPSSSTNSSLTVMRYAGMVVSEPYLLSVQVGARIIVTPTTLPTGVSTTVGYTAAGFGLGVTGSTNYLIVSAQIYNGDAYGVNIPVNDVTITGNTDAGASKRVTFTLRGNTDIEYVPITIPLLRQKNGNTGGEDGYGGTPYNVIMNPTF